MRKLAVVILNFNGRAFLERFLPSVVEHTPEGFSIWVADNGSTDSSLTFVRAQFPRVRILELGTNAGYAGGYNLALTRIEAEYYVLLNSDVEVTANWIAPILTLLDANPAIAACQPKIRAVAQPATFEYAGAAGGYLDWLGFAFCRGRLFDTLETDQGQYDDNRPVFWATGACLFVRGSAFRQTGGFDTAFFAHQEEIDWCWRLHRLGLQVWTCGQSTVYHVGGGTLPVSNPRKTYLNYHNSLRMLYKNLPAGRLWSTLLLRLVLDGLSSMRFLKAGQFRDIGAVLQAHGTFYRQLGSLRAQRKALLTQEIRNGQSLIYPKSIIVAYFLRGKKRFSELD